MRIFLALALTACSSSVDQAPYRGDGAGSYAMLPQPEHPEYRGRRAKVLATVVDNNAPFVGLRLP